MPAQWIRSFALLASAVALGVVTASLAVGIYKMSALSDAYSEQRRLAEYSKLSRDLIDHINHLVIGFTSIAVNLDADERAEFVGAADRKFRELDNTLPQLTSSTRLALADDKKERMASAIASIKHSWEEIRRQSGADMADEEKAYHFLKIYKHVTNVRDALRAIEADVAVARDNLSLSVHSQLQSLAQMLLLVVLLGAAVSLTAFFGTLHFSNAINRTNMALRERDAEVVEKGHRLDVALENMPHGLSMFDANSRLVLCNAHYTDMYQLGAADIRPGTSLQTLLERRMAADICATDSDVHIENVAKLITSGKPYQLMNKFHDGRVIAVTVQPMDGGGWVSIHQDITEQRRAEERIAYLAHHDALTGLPNRVQLRQHIDKSLSALQHGKTIAVLGLDLDYFKNVNDSLGHPFGDAVLCAVSERLRSCLRDTDFVARTGGDEFSILQVGAAQPDDASALAERLIAAMSTPFDLNGHHVFIGTSVGITIAAADGADPDALLKQADLALYRAKADGRNTFTFFEPEMDAKVQARRQLEVDLRQAIAAGEFELFYQPIVNLKDKKVSCLEALLRWNHPNRGRISPDQFIPLAEETGLIVPIGEWVIRQACAQAATWPADIRVAVNLSPVQFRNKTLVATVVSAMAAARLSPNRLEIEITESILLQNTESTLAVLHQLRDLGVRTAMDDFGTGYSSLSYLLSFPFDKIKIDKSFLIDLANKPESVAIVSAIAGLGQSFNMTTTAEGVETEDQLEQAREHGCTEIQGYLLSKPMPAGEIAEFLSRFELQVEVAA